MFRKRIETGDRLHGCAAPGTVPFFRSMRKWPLRVITMGLFATVSGSGCQWFRPDSLPIAIAPNRPASTEGRSAADGKPSASDGKTAASVAESSLARARKALAEPIWTHYLPSRDDDPSEVHCRWQHHGLDGVLFRSPAERPDLRRLLGDSDPVVAGNAAIGLARLGNAAGVRQLVALIRDADRTVPMRCAAVEALAGLAEPSAVETLRALSAEFGNFEPRRRSFYLADLHGELIRGLARHVAVADDPLFATALRSPSADVRLTAVEIWTAALAAICPRP